MYAIDIERRGVRKLFLAIRELFYSKLRYILIGLIMVLVASLIFIISGLAKGLSADNASAIQELQADYVILNSDAEMDMTKSFVSRSNMKQMEQADGIKEVNSLSIQMRNATVNGTDKNEDVSIFVTEPESMLLPTITEGNAINDANEVIVDQSLKREGIQLGDTLTFGEEKEVKVVGFTDEQRYSHTPVVFMTSKNPEKMNAFVVNSNGASVTAIQDEIGSSYEVATNGELLKGIPSYSQEQASLNMMIAFLYVIAAFVLAAFFYVITLQKRDQFGVLKALGAKTTYLIRSVIGQVLIISVLCIGVGVGLTYGIGAAFPADMPFKLSSIGMLQSSLLILAVSLVGALISLVQVIKIDPIEAIEGAGK
jgi:putative ABC transport system permease protein